MTLVRTLLGRLRGFDLRQVAVALLVVWAAGLVVAAVQLEVWQRELSRTLLQLSADAQFRARVGNQRDQVDPEWYRRKALSLLSAMEKIRHDAAWTLFVPGSWQLFDNLEERLSARMEREFADIVQETIRRELVARASRLTGAPQRGGGGEFQQPVRCAAPQVAPGPRRLAATLESLPEFTAVRDYVQSLQALDAAVQSWLALQRNPGAAGTEHLRRLVRYTLDADLPGPVSRSVALFGTAGAEGAPPPADLAAGLQAAARCSLGKGMGALHTRLLAANDLLVLEQTLAEHSAGLFDPRRSEPFAATVQRYRAVHAVLQDQEALLAQGQTGWMAQGTLRLGPAYDALLARIAGTTVLGPDVVQQVQAQSHAAFAKFRQQFQALYAGRAEPGVVWSESQNRFALSAQRTALRDGLGLLLQEPFMQLAEDGGVPPAPASLDEALATADMRRRVQREHLPRLPEPARAAVARVIDGRLALLAHDAAANAIRAAVPADAALPFDAAAFRAQRDGVSQVQALLVSMRAPDLAQRLGMQQTAELAHRLARAHEDVKALPLFGPAALDFSGWRGEPGPLLRAAGAADPGALPAALADQFNRLDTLGRQAEQYIAAADGMLASDPAAQGWQRLLRELDRYRARQADSSMVALERYLLALGPHLRRENCAENLLAQSPPRHDDAVAQRLTQIHNALVQRCTQLRAQGA